MQRKKLRKSLLTLSLLKMLSTKTRGNFELGSLDTHYNILYIDFREIEI